MEALLSQAVDAGCAYLAATQRSDGAWLSFQDADQWVTAFVLANTAGVPMLCQSRRRAARDWLIDNSSSGTWGYSQRHPPDCDSTAWALMALVTEGHVCSTL